jgi:carbonic anhydrase
LAVRPAAFFLLQITWEIPALKTHPVLLLLIFSLISSISAQAVAGGPEWTYEGASGPEHWGELSPEFSLCDTGRNQSPVDLIADLDANLPELAFDYHGTPLRETNNGHTIRIDIQPGNFLRIDEDDLRTELKQAHFHSPSEHTVGGRHTPMEIHLVHMDDGGNLTVVGIMIEEGEENPKLSQIWAFMPDRKGESKEAPVSVFEAGVLPPTRDYFRYNGSLTTPPCSEGVRWIVLKDPLTASAEQIATFKAKIGEASNRPVQPHNARLILD